MARVNFEVEGAENWDEEHRIGEAVRRALEPEHYVTKMLPPAEDGNAEVRELEPGHLHGGYWVPGDSGRKLFLPDETVDNVWWDLHSFGQAYVEVSDGDGWLRRLDPEKVSITSNLGEPGKGASPPEDDARTDHSKSWLKDHFPRDDEDAR